MSYLLSQDQAKAIREIGAWYRTQSSPYFTLGGYAGTGKTTLIAYLRQALSDFDEDASVGFCAYTGKATRVLADRLRDRKVIKRGDSVSTIHGLIYTTEETADGNPKWIRRDKLDRDLVIVDEASMVDRDIWEDLLSFNIPVLAVGDHGQLPPIGSSFYLMEKPMVRLDRIFRQASDSPIIEVATLARQSGVIPIKMFGPGVVKLDQSDPETGIAVQEILENWKPELLILCGYNQTRVKLNQTIRQMRDITSREPVAGDQVVCLRNNRTKHLFNGMLGKIARVTPAAGPEGKDWYEAEIELEGEDYLYTGYIYRPQFGARETVREMPMAPDGQRGDLWDFGYALTVHKAQGSQAEGVLVFEERFPKSSDDDWRRWLYTAVTRARVRLTVVGR
jgi:ATP-dependent exoDNAse (exonuclease V) alpha subunit